jgi:hypothetical protein
MARSDNALAACRELQVFAIANRPSKAPKHEAGLIVLGTVARSDKTFQAILHLCDPEAGGGYGEQAGMLARSLFEDMVTAHWATTFPERAVKQIVEQDKYVALENARVLKRYGLTKPGMTFLTVPKQEAERLKAHYSRGGWTRKTVPQMVKAIAPMWTDANERRLMTQMHDIGHRVSNTLMHHSSRSLSQNLEISDDGGITFSAGRTESHLAEALSMAFWIYVQTLSLVLDDQQNEALSAIYTKHRDVYSRVRSVESGEAAMADQDGSSA